MISASRGAPTSGCNNDRAAFVWSYRLNFNADSTQVIGFNQVEPSFNAGGEMWSKLFRRTFGQE
ncbi:MAG: hypothetical protein U5J63_14420 [Fodinibius sp.]|nr:hypothetical protein [Fodinibius sp.]